MSRGAFPRLHQEAWCNSGQTPLLRGFDQNELAIFERAERQFRLPFARRTVARGKTHAVYFDLPLRGNEIGVAHSVERMVEGVDGIIHLGGISGENSWEKILEGNIIGLYNVFEAARLAGVTRVIFASSGATVSGWEQEPPLSHLVAGRYAEAGTITPLTHDSPLRPSGLYGATKVWGEALARHYSDAYGMSVICLRIGRVKDEDRPTTTRDVAVWCSQRDIVRMIAACIEAPVSLRFDVFYVVSNLRHGYRDVEHARKVLGWTPMDSADTPR